MSLEPSSLSTYVVSLPQDASRRNELKNNFARHEKDFSYVTAVDGRKLDAHTYFQYTLPLYLKHRILMSPSEVGCSLSHIKAFEKFLLSQQTHALILEDDIQGSDDHLDTIINMLSHLKNDYILITGGQEGINTSRLYGKQIAPNLYSIPKASYPYIRRTCCYVITRESAKTLLAKQKKTLTVADWWNHLLEDTDMEMFYAPILKHPIDISSSNIEKERLANSRERKNYKANLYEHIKYKLSFKFYAKELSRFKRSLRFFLLRLKNYNKL